MKKLLIVPLLALMSTSAFAKICKDDPRLFTIKSVIEKMDAGETVKPIKLTPQTFLDMPPVVRNKLGDNILVYNKACVPNQVYQGTLPKSIEMPFPVLENLLQKALIRGDRKMADVILNQFIATPIKTDDAVLLISALPWPQSALDNLYQYKFFSQVVQNNTFDDNQEDTCDYYIATPTHIGLYALLGGKVLDSTLAGYYIEDSRLIIATENGVSTKNTADMTTLAQRKNPDNYDLCSGISFPRSLNSLTSAGVKIQATGSSYPAAIIEDLKAIIIARNNKLAGE